MRTVARAGDNPYRSNAFSSSEHGAVWTRITTKTPRPEKIDNAKSADREREQRHSKTRKTSQKIGCRERRPTIWLGHDVPFGMLMTVVQPQNLRPHK